MISATVLESSPFEVHPGFQSEGIEEPHAYGLLLWVVWGSAARNSRPIPPGLPGASDLAIANGCSGFFRGKRALR
jgi:hypothetical protein